MERMDSYNHQSYGQCDNAKGYLPYATDAEKAQS